MGNWSVSTYNTIAEAATEIELIDSALLIHVFGFKDGAHQKIVVVKAT